MKKLFILLVVFNYSIVNAQRTQNEKDSTITENLASLIKSLATLDVKYNTQLKTDITGKLSPFVYNKYVENKFTYLSFDRGVLPSANSASLDVLDNSTSLKLNFAKKFLNKDEQIWAIASAGVQAQLGDGIAELFKGNVATTGTTLFLNAAVLNRGFHFKTITKRFLNGKEETTAFGKTKPKMMSYKKDFEDKYGPGFTAKCKSLVSRLHDIEISIMATKLTADSLNKERENIKKRLLELCKLAETDMANVINSLMNKLHDVEISIAINSSSSYNLYKEKDEIEKQLLELGIMDGTTDDVADAIDEKYQDGYYNLITKKPAWEWFKLRWTSFGITYTRDAYITYDSTLGLNKRFGSKDFDSWGCKISENWFQQKSQQTGFIQTWYANISYEPKLTNSYAEIDAEDISKSVTAISSGDTTFIKQTNKKAKDISGQPYKTSWQHNFSAAYTAMFFKKNIGINLQVQSRISKISKPIYNTRAGVIFSLNNSDYDPEDKNSSAKVNFEFFIQFPDMSDVGESGKSVWQNKVIGISTNIPFNKIFFK